ncbi:MAG: hypothetical protein ACKVTZ_02925 [Bacteroidia bacterium]
MKNWTKQRLMKAFGLKAVKWHPALDEWLSQKVEITEEDKTYLTMLRENSLERIDDFNNKELLLKVIGPLLTWIHFDMEKYSGFADRALHAEIEEEILHIVPDFLVASGTQEPETPYFCLIANTLADLNGDAAGQCLAAMLAAQKNAAPQNPVYGCYIIGRSWYFMILQLDKFCISNVYTFTQDDIFQIFTVLKSLKEKVLIYTQ